MGVAEMWQRDVCARLAGTDWVVLNPRRDHWDSSWEQRIENPQFREQVDWELAGIESASKIIFYFAPNTKSPVSLLELGFCAAKGKDIAVVCPEGFWRKGNVDIVCARYNLRQLGSLEEACAWVIGD